MLQKYEKKTRPPYFSSPIFLDTRQRLIAVAQVLVAARATTLVGVATLAASIRGSAIRGPLGSRNLRLGPVSPRQLHVLLQLVASEVARALSLMVFTAAPVLSPSFSVPNVA